jgi:hypothetical protein
MEPTRLSVEEVGRLTDANAHLFVAKHPEYWPCEINSRKMIKFIISQVGEGYPFVWPIDFFENAFQYISQHDFFLPRPVEEEIEDAAVTRERLAQEKVRTDYAARQRAEQLRIAKTMPLNDLRNAVGVGDAIMRSQRSIAARTQDDKQSGRLTPSELDARAQARDAVMKANPLLNRNSLEFSKLVAAEMAK